MYLYYNLQLHSLDGSYLYSMSVDNPGSLNQCSNSQTSSKTKKIKLYPCYGVTETVILNLKKMQNVGLIPQVTTLNSFQSFEYSTRG